MKPSIFKNLVSAFTVIVSITAISIAVLTYYFSVRLLQERLDLNLTRTGKTVSNILNSQFAATDICKVSSDSIFQLQAVSIKWRDFFSYYLINPYNYYLRIYDKTNHIIWFTDNINDASDTLSNKTNNEFDYISLSTAKRNSTPDYLRFSNFEGKLTSASSIKETKILKNKLYKFNIFNNKDYIISVGQPYQFFEDFKTQLKLYLSAFVLLFIFTSLFISKYVLKNPINYLHELQKALKNINIRNKQIELPAPDKYEEFFELSKNINEILENAADGFTKLSRFSADVAHELKTPLTILRGELSLGLQGERTSKEYILLIASALEESVRLSGVVDALLELARAETGQIALHKSNSDLSKLVLEIAEDCEILAEEKSLIINSKIDNNIIFSFDKDRIYQAILNVIDNAIKYTPSNGVVTIDLQKIDNMAVLKIMDSGIGISKENLEKIFDRFFRTDEVKMKSISGLGLGLTMVKWIIDAHLGTIDVRSKLGEGTAFIITLPLI